MHNPVEAGEEHYRRGYWHTVAVLSLVAMLGFLDRALLPYIAEPIKNDFGITDLELSFLLGAAFVVLYGALTVPMGYLADRMARHVLTACGVFGWSWMMILSSFSKSYWQLFAGQIGLGIGEAVLPPVAVSLIQDSVPPKARGRAVGIYSLVSLNFGTGLAGLYVGVLSSDGARQVFGGIPLLRELSTWQLVLFWPGILGLLFSALALTVREPRRDRAHAPKPPAGLKEAAGHLHRNASVYTALLGSMIFANLAATGWAAWLPSVIHQRWLTSSSSIGTALGTLQLVLGSLGALGLGFFMDRTKRAAGVIQVAIIASVIQVIPTLIALLAPDLTIVWAAVGVRCLFSGGASIVSIIVLTRVTPRNLMGVLTGGFFLLVNVLGNAAGPTAVAVVARLAFSSPPAIANALILLYPVFMALSIGCLFSCLSSINRQAAGRPH